MECAEWPQNSRDGHKSGHNKSTIGPLIALWVLIATPAIAQSENDDTQPMLKGDIILKESLTPQPLYTPRLSSTDFAHDDFPAATAYVNGDYTQARLLAATQSAAGNARAQYLFATMLRKGLGGPVQSAMAVRWYQNAGSNGEVHAFLALAEMSFANEGGLSAGDGRGFLEKAARKGATEAKIALGQVFISGLGGPLDIKQAQDWYLTAVHDGSVRAKQLLGNLLYSQHEDAGALALYKEAARDGDARSAYQAGIILADPQSTMFNQSAAGPLIYQAAMAQLPEAMTAWAVFAIHENPPRPAEAARWLRKAAQADDGEGQYLYAIALAKGEGVQMDRQEAYEWAVRAVRHDPQDAERRALAMALGSAMPGPVRTRIEDIAKQPLLVLSHTPLP